MSATETVQQYVARQPSLSWRRRLMRDGLIRGFIFNVMWRVRVDGRENIPDTGPSIIMMSHAALIDPVLCMGAITNRFVIPMTKVENMEHPVIGPLVHWWGSYSVKRNEVDRQALVNSIELVKSGQLILIAPEGTRQKGGLAEPKDGLAYIATKADAVVIPTGISGASDWLAKLKSFKRPNILIRYGRPFKFKTEGRTRNEERSAMMREAMYQLALTLPEEMRGVYSDVKNATTDHLEFINPR